MGERSEERTAFQAGAHAGGDGEAARRATLALRRGDPAAGSTVAQLALHVAAVAPERLVEIYDGLTAGWLARAPEAPAVRGAVPAADDPGPRFWDAFWALVDDNETTRDPGAITVRTVELTDLVPTDIRPRVAAMAGHYPGVEAAAAGGLPGRFRLEDLARCPRDSLGGHLHALVVENGFDLEVLDRDTLGLAQLPPPLDYLNLRILQCHDVWHEVAGYETTGLHEVAISGFQMAQFGHHYSSMFLAVVLAKGALTQPPEAPGFLLDTILSAYRHGRETPPLLGIAWEDIWDRPIEEIRRTRGITAYDSPYPAGLLEELARQ
jgi:ubiquinone biosynthesis protein Coq4